MPGVTSHITVSREFESRALAATPISPAGLGRDSDEFSKALVAGLGKFL
jgi:hypothetical protein